jgi:flagellar assembly protein FliH
MKERFSETLHQAVKEAHERGLTEGRQQGRELQRQESELVLQSMNQALKECAQLRERTLAEMEEQIVGLSLAVAEKILHAEVTTNGEVIRNVLREAIRGIVDRDHMKIRLHPLDFRTMMAIKTDFLQAFDGIKNILFEEDDAIQRGGAVIETLFGEVDARLEQQFLEVKAGILPPATGE